MTGWDFYLRAVFARSFTFVYEKHLRYQRARVAANDNARRKSPWSR